MVVLQSRMQRETTVKWNCFLALCPAKLGAIAGCAWVGGVCPQSEPSVALLTIE